MIPKPENKPAYKRKPKRKRGKEETKRLRKQLIDQQDRRCPVCDIEIEYGQRFDEYNGVVVDQKCFSLCKHLAWKWGLILDRATQLVGSPEEFRGIFLKKSCNTPK